MMPYVNERDRAAMRADQTARLVQAALRAGLTGDEVAAGIRLGAAIAPSPGTAYQVWLILAGVVNQAQQVAAGPRRRTTRLVYLDSNGRPIDLAAMRSDVSAALDWAARFTTAYIAADLTNMRMIFQELLPDQVLWARTTNALFNLALQASRRPPTMRGGSLYLGVDPGPEAES